MPYIKLVDDALTAGMIDVLTFAPVDLGCIDSTVRVLLEARFLAREITPRLDTAIVLARSRRNATTAVVAEEPGLARAA